MRIINVFAILHVFSVLHCEQIQYFSWLIIQSCNIFLNWLYIFDLYYAKKKKEKYIIIIIMHDVLSFTTYNSQQWSVTFYLHYILNKWFYINNILILIIEVHMYIYIYIFLISYINSIIIIDHQFIRIHVKNLQ